LLYAEPQNAMRIAHLVPNLNFGGLQEVARGLVLGLKQRGHDVFVITWSGPSNHPEAEQALIKAGIPIEHLRWSPHTRLTSFRHLRRCLKAGNFDIFHVHNPFNYYLYGAVAARLVGVPKVVETLQATAMFDPGRLGKWDKSLFWVAAVLSDRVVSCCAEVEAVLRRRFPLPARKLAVVDNGIDLSRFLAVPPRASRPEVVFGTVGRMTPVKNHRVLVEAFALARRKYSHIRLHLLGGGPLQPELQERVRELDLSHSVQFLGYSDNVPGFLAGLDVYVLCSNSEGLPLSLMEAIAAGLPVVSTEVGGAPGIVRRTDSGWLCPPNNPQALMAAMELAICYPERIERGERARRFAAESYSMALMTSHYEKLYESLLHE
jgi:glycosyltransferase involved in cell wall biosynthesis